MNPEDTLVFDSSMLSGFTLQLRHATEAATEAERKIADFAARTLSVSLDNVEIAPELRDLLVMETDESTIHDELVEMRRELA